MESPFDSNPSAGPGLAPQHEWLRAALQAAESHVRRLRRADNWSTILGSVGSSLSAFLAGTTAIQGYPLPGIDWVTTCGVAATLSLGAGLSTGLHKGLGVSDRLSRAATCAGKLRALHIAASMGGREATDLARECRQVAAEYPDLLTA